MTDTAKQHRVASVYSLAAASSALAALAGVFCIQSDLIPGPVWQQEWMPGAISASEQQLAAMNAWIHLIVVFASLAAAAALFNAVVGMIGRANDRRYELGVHGLVGAPPSVLRRMQLREGIENALLGIGFGAPIGVAAAIVLRRLWPQQTTRLEVAEWVLLALVVALVVCGTLSLVLSARYRRHGWMSDALAPEARSNSSVSAEELRMMLNTGQLTGAIALTIVSILVTGYATTAPSRTHLDTENLYVARSHDANYPRGLVMASPGALLGLGQVDRIVSECRCVRAMMPVYWAPIDSQLHVVSPRFFANLGVDVLYGREFDGPGREREIIVNQTFARNAFDQENAVGRTIMIGGLGGARYRVVGVVADIPSVSLQTLEPTPLSATAAPGHAAAVYFSTDEHRLSEYDVIVRSARKPTYAGLDFSSFSRMVAVAAAPQRWFARVVLLLGILLCLISVGGAFVNTLLTMETRRAEIAVRRAVGARRRHIWMMVYGELARTFLYAGAVGTLLAAALSRAIEPLLGGLPWFRPGPTITVMMVFGIALLLATIPPVRKALQ